MSGADELGVTHGAISRQIKILEDWLGVRLFIKEGRRITLTADGKQFLEEATKLLDGLALASERLTGSEKCKVLRINAPQTFTMRWLIPRLPAFAKAHQGIEIRLAASIDPIEKVTDHFDLAIRRGPIEDGSTPFLSESCVPVASPRLIKALPVNCVADLGAHTFLHAESVASLWPRWLDKAGHPQLTGKAQLRFEPLYHSLQAAIDGAGVAMGPSALVAADIAAGRLVRLFPELPLTMEDFHVLVRPAVGIARHVGLFQRWLITEGSQDAEFFDRFSKSLG
ncbi:LysR family glycine cleavage system transcriptional activator [Rhizobium sp. BK313]|nr:LysR family glycine cleavage system transcriptional activator [Rhizobium sp. BK313]